MKRFLFSALAPAAAALIMGSSPATGWAQTYPDKPVRLVVPYVAGATST